MRKKSACPPSNVNSCPFSIFSPWAAMIPARKSAMAIDPNHIPIRTEANFAGASLVTIDSPTG